MWLYKLTNTVNGKSYIGTSVNPISHRISRHLYAAKNGHDNCMAITRAIRKYGLSSFTVQNIGQTTEHAELMRLEVSAIKDHGTLRPNGYNISSGGVGARRICSEQTRNNISSALKAKKMIPWNFGKRNANTIARYARTGHVGGPKPGTTSPKKGIKTGPLSIAHREAIAEGMRQIRAIRFWSTSKRETF